ncbi:TolC family protein [Salmonella enterica]|nr:TolC family protein [Salmonella enterica]EAX3609106.1 TolC family protein [Salmonella enterica]EGW6282678.1 TolC family protein [Salmonella enterica]EGX3935067.1 TolC family protein [Salmonella enterica]
MRKAAVLLLFIPFFSYADSLRDIIEKGVRYSMDNKISVTETDISEYKKYQTSATYWPTIDISAKTKTINHGAAIDYIRDEDEDSMINLNLRYTLLDLARDSDYEASKLSVVGTQLSGKIKKEKVVFNIISAYFNLWEKEQNNNYIKQYLDSVTDLSNKVQARVKGGLSPESDYLRAKVMLDDARIRYENSGNALNEAKIRLNYLIGESVVITDTYNKRVQMPEFIDENKVISISPVMKMLQTDIEVKEKGYRSAVMERLPKLYVQGSYKEHFKNTTSPDTQIYLQLTVPLFDGGIITYKSKEAAARKRISEYKLINAKRELNKNYGEIRSTIEKEYKLQKVFTENTSNAKKNILLYNSEFVLGTRPLSDLISAERELLTAHLSETESKRNYYISLAGMFNLYGNTIASLNYM